MPSDAFMDGRTNDNLTIEEYLKSLETFVDNPYGKQVRCQFGGIDGSGELAMLQSPSQDEYAQLCKAVAIMTPLEKHQAAALTDEQVERIADDAGIDKALLAIFINGFILKKREKNK